MPIVYDDQIKSPNMEMEYTREEIIELHKCSKNIFHFCKYVKIISLDKGKVTFNPYKYQKDLILQFQNNRFVVDLLCRQSGKSTVVGVFALHYAIFNADKYIGIVSNKEKSAKDILRRIKMIYQELPGWLKPGVVEWNKQSIEFDNGTKIEISATSESAFRGRSINLLIMDEFGFVPNGAANAFWAANYPAISASTESKIIIISTPNGMFNLFHKLYTDAEKGRNAFSYYFGDWKIVPGRDNEWAEVQRKNLGEQRFNQEFACLFLGSSQTVINSDVLRDLFEYNSINPLFYDLEDRLRVYEKPIEYAKYIMGVDTGKGTGKDASTIQVLRVDSTNPIKCEQVATFEHDKTDVYQFSEIVNRLSYYYNGAIMIVENNAEAAPVVNNLWYTYENMNLFCKGTDLGIRATKGTKTKSVLLMKKLIEEGSLKLNDANTIKELGSFIEERGKFFGKDLHDDLVSGLYWACYAFEEKDLFDESPQLINSSENDAWGILADIENNPDDGSWLYEEDKIERKENPNDWLRG